jgi:hypothetical protein
MKLFGLSAMCSAIVLSYWYKLIEISGNFKSVLKSLICYFGSTCHCSQWFLLRAKCFPIFFGGTLVLKIQRRCLSSFIFCGKLCQHTHGYLKKFWKNPEKAPEIQEPRNLRSCKHLFLLVFFHRRCITGSRPWPRKPWWWPQQNRER